MLRRLIGEDILLTTTLSPELALVKADPVQIEQVLMNLAVNARDAMPQGGKLTIETQNVTLGETDCRGVTELSPGEYVLVTVSDSGSGMDEATQARIFEPFFSTKGVGKGTGLGLAIVHGIIKQSRGYITVASEVGQGTTFRLYLPRIHEPVTESRSTTPPPTEMPTGNETILLVEDEDVVRALGRHVLLNCGYRVLEAADGKDAMQIVESHAGPIHLLISDVVMPHLGGRELAERVTTMRPECQVLFLSGHTEDAITRHGVLEAEFAFLPKPFTPAALAQQVRSMLDTPPSRNHQAPECPGVP
jgi:CheY-like chemotaxis protein